MKVSRKNERKLKLKAMTVNWMVAGNSKTRNVDLKLVSNNAKTIHSKKSDPKPQICGKTNHNTPDCRATRSEFANHDNQPYVGYKL